MRMILAHLFDGRNGMDRLNVVLLAGAGLSWIASSMVSARVLRLPLHYLFLFLVAVVIVRAMSRNIARRQAENQRFLKKWGHVHNTRESFFVRAEQRRQYKIFKCPSCGIKLRVPRGKGQIKVSCRQCGATFIKKS